MRKNELAKYIETAEDEEEAERYEVMLKEVMQKLEGMKSYVPNRMLRQRKSQSWFSTNRRFSVRSGMTNVIGKPEMQEYLTTMRGAKRRIAEEQHCIESLVLPNARWNVRSLR